MIHVERRLDRRLGEIVSDAQVISGITPYVGQVRAKWLAAATQEGFDLVAAGLAAAAR